jgi:predicted nucleotide-binding protein (sugar kinase/HSP70/actin superfamily)
MRIAFPLMGNIQIPLGALLRALGAESIIPPKPTAEVTALGVRLAPEQMCIPFKITLGNFVRAMELGADTLAYGSGSWQCRYGYYFRLHQNILNDLGYRFDLITLRVDEYSNIARHIVRLSDGNLSRALVRTARAFRIGWAKSTGVDSLEHLSRWHRPREVRSGTTTRLLAHYLSRIDATDSPPEVKRLRREAEQAFAAVEIDPGRKPLRIKVLGESFCVLEPFVNLNVLERLGAMGVWADSILSTHQWLGFHALRVGDRDRKRLLRPVRRYWRYGVGGEDEPAVAHTLEAARLGYDGILHLHPFGCMPSTVVGPVLSQISREYGIPLLDISLDEHSSELGFYNRIEAFLSVLDKRRKKNGRRRIEAAADGSPASLSSENPMTSPRRSR